MDIKKKTLESNSQGNAASELSDYVARAGSWQYGRNVRHNDIEAEKKEEDLKFGVPNTTEPSNGK